MVEKSKIDFVYELNNPNPININKDKKREKKMI